MKYGRLTLLAPEGLTRDRHKCLCDCGEIVFIHLARLRSGNTRSCGCLKRDLSSKRFRKHYGRGTPEYTSWQLMKDRCYNANNKTYSYYGGKGISVCDEWRNDFVVFLRDMGIKPSSSHTLDRIDGNKNYCSDNCRWATKTEQARNRKNTKTAFFNGQTKPLAEWCEILDMDYNNTNKRLWRGWSVERAFTVPKKEKYNAGSL